MPAHTPEFTVIDMPGLHAEPSHHGTNSEVFIILNFAKKLVLIGGSSYAGEIKKSIFTVMNYLLPLQERAVHALLGQRRAGTVTSRSSSGCPAPARRRCRAIRTAA